LQYKHIVNHVIQIPLDLRVGRSQITEKYDDEWDAALAPHTDSWRMDMKLFRTEATVAEYEDAKRRVTAKTIMRLSRGNTNVQNGNSCSEERLQEKSKRADDWMLKTQRAVEAAG
jgi:hypothetical protein